MCFHRAYVSFIALLLIISEYIITCASASSLKALTRESSFSFNSAHWETDTERREILYCLVALIRKITSCEDLEEAEKLCLSCITAMRPKTKPMIPPIRPIRRLLSGKLKGKHPTRHWWSITSLGGMELKALIKRWIPSLNKKIFGFFSGTVSQKSFSLINHHKAYTHSSWFLAGAEDWNETSQDLFHKKKSESKGALIYRFGEFLLCFDLFSKLFLNYDYAILAT